MKITNVYKIHRRVLGTECDQYSPGTVTTGSCHRERAQLCQLIQGHSSVMVAPRASTGGIESAASVTVGEAPSLRSNGAPGHAGTFRQPQVPHHRAPGSLAGLGSYVPVSTQEPFPVAFSTGRS